MREVLGEKLAGSTMFKTFTRKREGNDQGFDIAPLANCRFIGASEGNARDRMNEAMVKTMTGGDAITACFKNMTDFTFKPKWKICLVSNFKPKGDVNDNAFWDRFIMIIFPNSFAGKEDTELKERFCKKENLEGVLLWIVQGAKMWFDGGKKLETPQVFKDALSEAKQEQDLAGRWLAECCDTTDGKAQTPIKWLYAHFEKWCEGDDEKATAWKLDTFREYMKNRGFVKGRAYFEVKGTAQSAPLKQNGKVLKTQEHTYVGIKREGMDGSFV